MSKISLPRFTVIFFYYPGKLSLLSICLMLLLSACEKPDEELVRISKHGGSSHYAGQDCTQVGCHDKNSNIQFSYAGTVYVNDNTGGIPNTPISNADIHFVTFTATGKISDASIDSTIEVDANGNFYTTSNLVLNYPTQVPCMVPPGTTDFYCMPHNAVADISGNSCSNPACHLNNRINSDVNYLCTDVLVCIP